MAGRRFGFGGALQAKALRTFTLTFTLTLSSVAAHGTTLESSNPFLPPGYGIEQEKPPEPVRQSNGPLSRELEFRGIAQLGGTFQFSVFNKSEQKGYWLKEDQMEDGIQVRGYDADSRSITVTKNGRSERLSLMSASEAPLPVASSVNVARPNNPTPAAITNNGQNVNNPDGERRRVIPRRRVILPKK